MELCFDCAGKCGPECLDEHHVSKCGKAGRNEIIGANSGIKCLASKKYNKGLAFTIEERQFLGIHGLLPAVVKTPEEQLKHCVMILKHLKRNLDKYIYLMSLAERNQRLFYQLIHSDILTFLPLIYMPTVGEACQKFSMIYQHPQGLYITIKDKGHIYDILCNWPERDVRAIVVTDGERLLGLGDLGAHGMAICLTTVMMYTAIGGIRPEYCLPIMLDCGTNKDSLIIDPLYIGIKERRLCGCRYDEFLDEFMRGVVRRFGPTCLMHFEDFGNKNAFRLLSKYENTFCMFNNDIQGTAAIVLSGILAALKASQQTLKSQRILFFGAGEACIGIARLLRYALGRHGVFEGLAKKLIWLFDTKGLVVIDRPAGGLTNNKLEFARVKKPMENFLDVLDDVRPTILIGAAATPGAFTPEVLKLMAEYNSRPIIFALSNPADKAECTAKAAYTHTNGKCLFASGSPFPPVDFKHKRYYPAQCNNGIIVPGIALGVICAGMRKIPEEVFFIAADALAELVTFEELSKGHLFPSLTKFTCFTTAIARWVMEYAYRFDLATVYPEPENKIDFIKTQIYDLNYPTVIPDIHVKDEIF